MIYARSSEIGKIPRKSKLEKDFKNFLIDFRSIAESYIDIDEKLFKTYFVDNNKKINPINKSIS